MSTLICVLVPLMLVALIVAAIVGTLLQHGGKIKELCEYGLEAVAVIERNDLQTGFAIGGFIFVESKPAERRRVITYRYTDTKGATHTGSHNAPASEANELSGLAVGAPFPIVYSSRKPTDSAPKQVVDQFRQVFQKSRQ